MNDILSQNKDMEISEKFQVLAETSPTAIMMYQDNKWIYVNPAAEEMTGYSQSELLSMDFWDIVHPDFLKTAKTRGEARQKGINIIQRYELKIITKEGEERWADLSGNVVEVNGRPAGIINVLDITDHKRFLNTLEGIVEYSINMLARSAEVFDSETGNHIRRIGDYSELLASKLGAPSEFRKSIQVQAQLHDVGKIYIYHDLLNKPGRLTGDEFDIIKRHTVNGGRIIGRNPSFALAHQIALYHHERRDGSGYPYGLKGEEIPFATRIVSIVDVFDALITKRSYKEPFSYQRTYEIMSKGDIQRDFYPKRCFDPVMLSVFLNNYDEFVRIHEQSILIEDVKQHQGMDVLVLDDDPVTRNLFDNLYRDIEGIQLYLFDSVTTMRDHLFPSNAHMYLCFVDIELPDGTGHDAANELKRRYPNAHLVCIPSAAEKIKKEKLYLYDRIFHKPLDPDNILEITETIRKYYFKPFDIH